MSDKNTLDANLKNNIDKLKDMVKNKTPLQGFMGKILYCVRLQYLIGVTDVIQIDHVTTDMSRYVPTTGDISYGRIKSHLMTYFNLKTDSAVGSNVYPEVERFIDDLMLTAYSIAVDDAKGIPRFRGFRGGKYTYSDCVAYPSESKYSVLMHDSYKDAQYNNTFYEEDEIKNMLSRIFTKGRVKVEDNSIYKYFTDNHPFTNADKYEIAYTKHLEKFLSHVHKITNFQDVINDFNNLLKLIGGNIYTKFNINHYTQYVTDFARAVDKEISIRTKKTGIYATKDIISIVDDILFKFKSKVYHDKSNDMDIDAIKDKVEGVDRSKFAKTYDKIVEVIETHTKNEIPKSTTTDTKPKSAGAKLLEAADKMVPVEPNINPLSFLGELSVIQKQASLGILTYAKFKEFVVNLLKEAYLAGYVKTNGVCLNKVLELPDSITTFPDDLDKLLKHNGTKAMGAEYILKDDVWYIREIKPETYQMLITTMVNLYELGLVSDIYIKGE